MPGPRVVGAGKQCLRSVKAAIRRLTGKGFGFWIGSLAYERLSPGREHC